MTTFNQEGQTVHGAQTNVGGDVGQVNVGTGLDLDAALAKLERLRSELAQEAQFGEIDPALAHRADRKITDAINEIRQPQPDRRQISDHLTQAQDVLKTAAAAAGLITAMGQVAEVVHKIL